MVKANEIDEAIEVTIKFHPEFIPFLSEVLFDNTTRAITPNNFTRENGARDVIRDASRYDFINFICQKLLKIYNAAINYHKKLGNENFKNLFPNFDDIQRIVGRITNNEINSILYLATRNNELTTAIACVAPYYQNARLNEFINSSGMPEDIEMNDLDKFIKIDADHRMAEDFENLRVSYRPIKECKLDLMSGAQFKSQRSEYSIGNNLYALQDKGKNSRYQEDAVAIDVHPKNENFKLLAVSDGMGGLTKGEDISRFIIYQLTEWFEKLSPDVFAYPDSLANILDIKIRKINDAIYERYNSLNSMPRGGATLTCAIVADGSTIIANVGDSRCYIEKNRYVDLVTNDESPYAPQITDSEEDKGKLDDYRFDPKNVYVNNYMGIKELKRVQLHVIPNTYDKLILMTDGITDILSYDTIKFITNNTPLHLVAKALVNEALNNSVYRVKQKDEDYNRSVQAGKGNATAAVLGGR